MNFMYLSKLLAFNWAQKLVKALIDLNVVPASVKLWLESIAVANLAILSRIVYFSLHVVDLDFSGMRIL